MNKLKNILQSKFLYYGMLVLVIVYTLISINFIPKVSLYNLNEHCFIVKIVNIKENERGKTITLKGKEKLITYVENDFLYELGDTLEVRGYLEIPKKNTIPNLFNYRRYLYNQDIFYILNIEETNLIKKNDNIFYKLKSDLTKLIKSYQSKNYLHAFILGNTAYISDEMSDKYQELGINHLFAISGMHVSFLVMILSFIFQKLKFNKYFIFIINTIFLIFYMFLINFQVSIMRSFLGYFLFNLNRFLKLNIKSEYLIISIFAITLLFNPYNLYNLGFQYSYLISFVLIKYNSLIKGNYLKKVFIISFLAFLGGLPITINANYGFNLLTILYNMLYVPLINIIIFPCALLCIIFPFLDKIFYFLTTVLEEITLFISEYSIIISLKKMSFLWVLVYFIAIFFIFENLKKKKYFSLVYLIILIIFHYNINSFNSNSFLMFLGVSQGDSTLIHYERQNILIDTGGSFGKNYSNDLIEFTKSTGIRKLDYLIITHGDYDHMGEAIDLVNNFKVEKVIFNCGEFNDLEKELISVLNKKKIKYYSCIKELNVSDNKLYFLNNKDYGNENDNSIVLYTEINNKKFLFMGDASVKTEKDIMNKYNLKDIDVIKVGHHGSKTSSSKEFINAINPKYSIISVGKNNIYHHPNNEVLEILDKSKIYRTDIDGSIMFKLKNNKLDISTCPP